MRGILGLEPDAPYGCIVRMAVKGQRGNPVRKDRFHILDRTDVPVAGSQLAHPPHPAFTGFNSLPDDDPRARKLSGFLFFPKEDQNFRYHLAAQTLTTGRQATKRPPGGGVWDPPPNRQPACTGDGRMARRYDGQEGDGSLRFIDIPCPNEMCPFRLGDKKDCGAFGLLYFFLDWGGANLPRMLARFQSGGWETVRNMLGMFESVKTVARGLGLRDDQWVWTGMPFHMTMGERVKPGKRYPIANFALGDVPGWLTAQVRERSALLKEAPRLLELGEGMREVMEDPREIVDALDTLRPQAVPQDVVDVEIETPPEKDESVDDDGDPRAPIDRIRDLAQDLEIPWATISRIMRHLGFTEDLSRSQEKQLMAEIDKLA